MAGRSRRRCAGRRAAGKGAEPLAVSLHDAPLLLTCECWHISRDDVLPEAWPMM